MLRKLGHLILALFLTLPALGFWYESTDSCNIFELILIWFMRILLSLGSITVWWFFIDLDYLTNRESNKTEITSKGNKMTDKVSYHKLAASIIVTGLIILSIFCVYAWNATPDDKTSLIEIWIWRVSYSIILIFFIVISLKHEEIGPNEIGIILQFGKPMFQIGPGFIWLPITIVWKLQRETSLVIEEQYPEDEDTDNGKVRPIYITHGASPKASINALDNRITTSVSIVCRYKIVDLIKFITSIGNKDQLRRQIRDIVVTTVQIECSKETLDSNLNRLPEINSILKKAVEELTANWGIIIVNVLLQKIDLGEEIKGAFTNVTTAQINQKANEYNAKKIFFEGSARAEVHKAFQFAKAEGYKVIAKKLNISEPAVLYQIDKLAEMWTRNNADVNLYAGDMAEVFKMVTAFSKITSGNSDNNKIE